MAFGERAIKLMPHSVPARYRYQLNMGRYIRDTCLFNKARDMNALVGHLIFCVRENSLYKYSGA